MAHVQGLSYKGYKAMATPPTGYWQSVRIHTWPSIIVYFRSTTASATNSLKPFAVLMVVVVVVSGPAALVIGEEPRPCIGTGSSEAHQEAGSATLGGVHHLPPAEETETVCRGKRRGVYERTND